MERFLFDPESLSYKKVDRSRKRKLTRSLAFTGLVLSIAFGILYVRDTQIKTHRSANLMARQQQILFELNLMNRDMEAHQERLQQVAFNDDKIYRVYFGVDPLSSSKRRVGVGGSRSYEWVQQYNHANLLTRTHQNIDLIERKLAMQSSSFDDVIDLAWTKEEWLAARPAIQPVSIKDLTRFGSAFGKRFHPILKVVRPHEGIDLTAPRGTPIYATADGTVLQAGYREGGFGKKVLLDHGYGYRTVYGHCDEVLVEPGQKVTRGEVIARVGSTGLSKSPHLHYEVHVNGRPVDPINYYATDLSPKEYDQMIDLFAQADPSFDIN